MHFPHTHHSDGMCSEVMHESFSFVNFTMSHADGVIFSILISISLRSFSSRLSPTNLVSEYER